MSLPSLSNLLTFSMLQLSSAPCSGELASAKIVFIKRPMVAGGANRKVYAENKHQSNVGFRRLPPPSIIDYTVTVCRPIYLFTLLVPLAVSGGYLCM